MKDFFRALQDYIRLYNNIQDDAWSALAETQRDILSTHGFPCKNIKSWKCPNYMVAWYGYKTLVKKELKKNQHLIPDINLKGWRAYHIDHIISIWDGFLHNVPVEKISSIENLRMLPYDLNMKKGKKSDLEYKF